MGGWHCEEPFLTGFGRGAAARPWSCRPPHAPAARRPTRGSERVQLGGTRGSERTLKHPSNFALSSARFAASSSALRLLSSRTSLSE